MPKPQGNAKIKNFKSSFKKMLGLVLSFPWLFWMGIITIIIASGLACFSPVIIYWIVQDMIRFTIGQDLYSQIVKFSIILILFYLSSFILNAAGQSAMSIISAKISRNLRTQIIGKITRLPLKYYDSNTIGNTLSKITNDVGTLSDNLSQAVTALTSGIFMLVGLLVAMFSVSWQLALSCFIALPLGFIAIAFVIKKSKKIFSSRQKDMANTNSKIEETFTGIQVVKLFNLENKQNKQFDVFNQNLKKTSRQSIFYGSVFMAIMSFVGNLGYAIVGLVCALLAFSSATVEQGVIEWIALFPSFAIFVAQLNNPLSNISQGMNSFQYSVAAIEKIFEFLNEPEEKRDLSNKKLKKVRGSVELSNVEFSYNDDKKIINNFSVKIKPGMKVAIVGPTGAGKTTIVNLLMRFYEINKGSIAIDGVNVQDMRREYLRSLFGMVLQDSWTFKGTIKQNIVYTSKNADLKKVRNISKITNFDHVIESLPNGYDTIIDEKTNLSAGEKQLLTITRAMIQDAPMIILDEATSNVDTRTELEIQKAMDNLTNGRTSFVIAHRLSTIKNADLILVMNHGDIVEHGTHNALLKYKGFYAKLYESQFSSEL